MLYRAVKNESVISKGFLSNVQMCLIYFAFLLMGVRFILDRYPDM